MSPSRILVTGLAGCIGRHLAIQAADLPETFADRLRDEDRI